jgi:hypothetical protein
MTNVRLQLLPTWRQKSRINPGQVIKNPTAASGQQALELLLRE